VWLACCIALLAQPAPERVLVLDPGEPGTQYNRHVVHSDETDYVVIPVRGRCMVIYTSPSGVSPTEEVPAVAQRKCAITIPAAQVGTGGVTDFSVLLTRSAFPDEMCSPINDNRAQADGGDIRFYSDSALTSRLACDLIAWELDSSDGARDAAIQIRVNVPSLSSVADNTIYVSYNQGEAETQPAAGEAYGQYAAYDSGWAAYWPMREGSGASLADRTSGQSTGTISGATWSTLDGEPALSFNGTSDRINVSASTGLRQAIKGTAFAILRPASVTGKQRVFSHHRLNSNNGFSFGLNGTYIGLTTYGVQDYSVPASLAINTTYHVAWLLDSAHDLTAYKNGASQGQALHTAGGNVNSDDDGIIGAEVTAPGSTTYTSFYSGLMRELQIHLAERSAAWITTEYNQTNDPAIFATPGTPETVGGGALIAPLAMYYRRRRAS
jgi:hypothetical protein